MPDDSSTSSSSSSSSSSATKSLGTPMIKPDDEIVATLVSMGFDEVGNDFSIFGFLFFIKKLFVFLFILLFLLLKARCAKAAVRTNNSGADDASNTRKCKLYIDTQIKNTIDFNCCFLVCGLCCFVLPVEWLLAHSEDADIDAPLEAIAAPAQPSAATAVKTVEYNQPAHVEFLSTASSMGFDVARAKRALARHVSSLAQENYFGCFFI